MKICKCDGWVKSIIQLESAQTIAATHGWRYEGEFYQFCPWCGSKLANHYVLEKIAEAGKPLHEYRPWTAEEIPFPCRVRHKSGTFDYWFSIEAWNCNRVHLSSGQDLPLKELFEDYVQYPSGIPCGVKV